MRCCIRIHRRSILGGLLFLLLARRALLLGWLRRLKINALADIITKGTRGALRRRVGIRVLGCPIILLLVVPAIGKDKIIVHKRKSLEHIALHMPGPEGGHVHVLHRARNIHLGEFVVEVLQILIVLHLEPFRWLDLLFLQLDKVHPIKEWLLLQPGNTADLKHGTLGGTQSLLCISIEQSLKDLARRRRGTIRHLDPLIHNHPKQLFGTLARFEWRTSGQHLVRNTSQGPKICRLVVSFPGNHLRCHVFLSTTHSVGPAILVRESLLGRVLGETKVRNADVTVS